MRRIINLLIILTILLTIYFRYFHYVDIQNKCSIKIQPSFLELSNRNMIVTLKTLKHGSPQDYKYVCSYVNNINPNISCGGFRGGCFTGDEGKIHVSTGHSDIINWTAAVIVHETCHAVQKRDNRPYSENECAKIDARVSNSLVDK